MASSPKQLNGNISNKNVSLGKRKKLRSSKGTYLSKWLDKTMHHIQDSTPTVETYDPYLGNVNMNWPLTNHGFPPGFDNCRFMYGCAPEPLSLPTLPTYYNSANMSQFYAPELRYVQNVNKSNQVQRPRQRRRSENKPEELPTTPNGTPSCTLSNNYFQPKNFTDSQDFASLPPIITSVGDTASNSDLHNNEKDEENSNTRRFSDPCVRGLPDVARPANGDVESESESSEDSGSQVGSRLLNYLLDQIGNLKLTNEKLNKELHETKAELSTLQQQNVIWQKGPGQSMGAATSLNNGMLGGQYSPGFLTELVREIRDAARMREEALYSRVRAMLHERLDNSLSSSDAKFSDKSLEEIKSALRASEADKRRMMDRIAKLEDELRLVKVSTGIDSSELNGNIDSDSEKARLRREVADMRKAKISAEEHSSKLERLVTQLHSKFNGLQLPTNGPESLASEPERTDSEPNARARRTSANSTNSTVVFGPVTDL